MRASSLSLQDQIAPASVRVADAGKLPDGGQTRSQG